MGFFSKSFNPLADLPDLSGKVVIVTGGKGIGYATIKHLARKGAKVYMVARNKTKAEAAIARLKMEGLGPGNGQVIWLELDLLDPRNAKTAAQEFMSKEKRLDVLVHNAAIFCEPYRLTADGVQEIFIVNTISPFVLTRELMPVLNQTASEPKSDVRVVVVSSTAHQSVSGKVRFRNVDDFNDERKGCFMSWYARYAYSKLGNILYASELQRRLNAQGSPITVVSLHPGIVDTLKGRTHWTWSLWFISTILYPFMCLPDVGAYTSVFAAASPIIAQVQDKFKGSYLVPVGTVQKPTVKGSVEDLAEEMWGAIETFLEDKKI